jgi:hypothetical protein
MTGSMAHVRNGPELWLVIDKKNLEHLADVLSPFERM